MHAARAQPVQAGSGQVLQVAAPHQAAGGADLSGGERDDHDSGPSQRRTVVIGVSLAALRPLGCSQSTRKQWL